MPLKHVFFRAAIALSTGTVALLMCVKPGFGAEKVVLTYGAFGRSLLVSELEDFANDAPPPATLKFLLNRAGQDPDQARSFLRQELPMSPKTVDELLNLLPGEFVLFQVGQIFHTPERQANVEALRSSLVLSTVDDRRISVLEFLRNYPTREFYVDGQRLAKTAKDVSGFVGSAESEVKKHLGGASGLLGGLLCNCASSTSLPESKPAEL